MGSVPVQAVHMRPLNIPSRQCMEEDAEIHHCVGDGMAAVERISNADFQESLQFQHLVPPAVLCPVAKEMSFEYSARVMSQCRSCSSSQFRSLPPVVFSCARNNIPTLPTIRHIFKLNFACFHSSYTRSLNSVHPFQFCLTRHTSHTCGHSASITEGPDS
jgi:hypothetical protein